MLFNLPVSLAQISTQAFACRSLISVLTYRSKKYGRTFEQCRQSSSNQEKHLSNSTLPGHKVNKGKDSRIVSTLFVSDAHSQHTAHVELDLDLDWKFGEGYNDVLQSVIARNMSHDWKLHELKEKFDKFKEIKEKVDTLEKERQEIAKKFKAAASSEGKTKISMPEKNKLRTEGQKLKQKVKELMPTFWKLEEEVIITALQLPQVLHKDTNLFGIYEILNMKLRANLPQIDVVNERLEKCFIHHPFNTLGFYTTGKGALMERDFVTRSSTCLRNHGFTQITCPAFFKSLIVEGYGDQPIANGGESYKLDLDKSHQGKENEIIHGKFVRGTSPLSFLAYLTRMRIAAECLPMRLYNVGSSYHNLPQDAKNVYSSRQTMQAHTCTICPSYQEAGKIFDQQIDWLWQRAQALDLPLRLVHIPAEALHVSQARRVNLEIKAPSLNKYIQVASVSDSADFHSRRLKFRQCKGNEDFSKSMPVFLIFQEWLDITKLVALCLEYNMDISENQELQNIFT